MVPAQINKRALNIAWVIRWKKVNKGAFNPRLIIIMPSWLSVERAIIFFISFSTRAARPAMVVVRVAIISKRFKLKGLVIRRGYRRKRR